jgi:hypothetical protein
VGVTGTELILAALMAGAATGGGEMTRAAALDAYGGLRDVLRRRFGGDEPRVLEAGPGTDPDQWRAHLQTELDRVGAGRDADVLAAARAVLELMGTSASVADRYQVDARGARGVQIGDHNTQHNAFS